MISKVAIPKTLGACVDKLYALDQRKNALTEQIKKLEADYTAIETRLLERLPLDKLNGAAGKLATATIDKKDYPSANDWDKLRRYIVKNDAWDLLQKRLSSTAFRERWAVKRVVPGVAIFTKVSLKLAKRRKR